MSRTLTAVGGMIALLAVATLGVTAAAPGAGQPITHGRPRTSR
jgi:hypothetical protein